MIHHTYHISQINAPRSASLYIHQLTLHLYVRVYIYLYIQQQQSLSPKFFGVDDQVLKTFRINILEISPLDYTFLLFLTCTSNFVLIESKNHALCIILKYQKKNLKLKHFIDEIGIGL